MEDLEPQDAGNCTDKTEILKQKGLIYSWTDNQGKLEKEEQNGCDPW